ncbi:hypothetical protein HYDPIDRAFT_118905, partial [Hydnomerulius pinastri MD-312]
VIVANDKDGRLAPDVASCQFCQVNQWLWLKIKMTKSRTVVRVVTSSKSTGDCAQRWR